MTQCGHGLQDVAALRYVRWNILLADPSFGMETAGRLFAFGIGDQPDVVGTHTHGKPFLHLAELVGAEPGLGRQSYQDGGIARPWCRASPSRSVPRSPPSRRGTGPSFPSTRPGSCPHSACTRRASAARQRPWWPRCGTSPRSCCWWCVCC